MKKVIAIFILLLTLVSVMAGCGTKLLKVEDLKTEADTYSMFIVVESTVNWNVVYHKDTYVMYVTDGDDYFTMLVDEQGWPLLWEEQK